MSRIQSLAFATLAVASLSVAASADVVGRPGSLLVYPTFQNNLYTSLVGVAGNSFLTVTNTNNNLTPVSSAPGALATGTVDVEFVYIDGNDCLEFNRTRRLTPNDTLTVSTNLDNPNDSYGYVYVFAKSPTTGRAIKWDYLIGDSIVVSPYTGASNVTPFVFKAGAGLAEGAPTDVDNDFVRDLDGTEYEKVPDKLLVPRFISHYPGISVPTLALIGLSGPAFTTTVDFLVYNDNEEVFSAQYSFGCYAQVPLAQINGVFTDAFLDTTNNAAPEYVDLSVGPIIIAQPVLLGGKRGLPAPAPIQLETGWFRMDASIASSTAAAILNPAFLAYRTDVIGYILGFSSQPYGLGEQANGDLVPHGPFPN